MRRPPFVPLLAVLLAGIIACDLGNASLPTSAPTVDRVATSVSETLTAQSEATAVAATVAALSQAKSNTGAAPTTPPATFPAPTTSPLVSPTPTPVYYNLIMRYSKNCLGVQGNQAIEATCGQSTQLWSVPTDASAGNFQVQLQNTGNCLSASSTTPADPFILNSCGSDGGTQLWQKRPSGGYFQLANNTQLAASPTTYMCVDARQFDQPIIQWFCKPWGTDDQLDNQLLCQTTGNTANCTPPAGVYVTNIQEDPPYTDEGKPNTFHINFRVTFSNTTGYPQSYTWFVRTFGTNGGQTPQQTLTISPGTTTISVGPWNIGRTCTNYTAKAVWIRASDGLSFSFKDPDGREYSLPFQVHTDPGC